MTEQTKHGQTVYRDPAGLRFVRVDGFAWYVTDCCDAAVTIDQPSGDTVCRACLEIVAPELGGNPPVAPAPPLDLTKPVFAEWKVISGSVMVWNGPLTLIAGSNHDGTMSAHTIDQATARLAARGWRVTPPGWSKTGSGTYRADVVFAAVAS